MKQTLNKELKMADLAEYKKIFADLIAKQMVVLGPNIALDKARKVAGLKIADDGTVLQMDGDPVMVLKSVINEFMALSGQTTQMILKNLSEKYPSIKAIKF